MNLPEIKKIIKTPRGRIILICMVLILLGWIYTFTILVADGGKMFPDAEDISTAKNEIKKARSEYNAENAKMQAAKDVKALYEEQRVNYWNNERDGNVQNVMREMLEYTAQSLELKFSSLGYVRETVVDAKRNELAYEDIDFSLSDEFPKLMTFIYTIDSLSPKLYWKQITIQREFQRPPPPQSVTTSSASAQTTAVQNLRLAGTLRVIRYNPEPDSN